MTSERRDRRKRPIAWLAVATLLTAACARTARSAGGDVPTDPPETSSTDVIHPTEDPVLIDLDGPAPLWNVSLDITEEVIDVFFEGGWLTGGKPRTMEDIPDDCATLKPYGGWENPALRDCVDRILTERGLDRPALDLFWSADVSIFGLTGAGPVKIVDIIDWRCCGSNGVNADMILTADGILDIGKQKEWRPYLEATTEATSAEVFTRISEAVAPEVNTPWGEPGPPLTFAQWGGQDTELGEVVRTAGGWAVPVNLILTGCHACETPFVARFAFDFSEVGVATGVRFLGWCDNAFDPMSWTNVDALTDIASELPDCVSPPTL